MNHELTQREFYAMLRKRKNIKQREIANYINVNRSLISLFERDKYTLSNERVKAYEQYIDNKK